MKKKKWLAVLLCAWNLYLPSNTNDNDELEIVHPVVEEIPEVVNEVIDEDIDEDERKEEPIDQRRT